MLGHLGGGREPGWRTGDSRARSVEAQRMVLKEGREEWLFCAKC